MNLPNFLTTIRFFLIPVFVMVFFSDNPDRFILSFVVFVVAGITDVMDGYIARKYQLITTFGTVMDPLADKLMLLTVLACYTVEGTIPAWLLGIMVIKELLMIAGGLYLYYCKEKHVVASNAFGKWATVFFYIAIVVVVFTPNSQGVIWVLSLAVLFKLVAFYKYATGFHLIHQNTKRQG